MTPVAQTLSGVATVAGIFAAIVTVVVGALTFRATAKGQRGSDLERLQGSLSKWSQETIADLRADLAREEQRRRQDVERVRAELLADCERRCGRLREDLEAKLALADYRVSYWKQRALDAPDPDKTPPPGSVPKA